MNKRWTILTVTLVCSALGIGAVVALRAERIVPEPHVQTNPKEQVGPNAKPLSKQELLIGKWKVDYTNTNVARSVTTTTEYFPNGTFIVETSDLIDNKSDVLTGHYRFEGDLLVRVAEVRFPPEVWYRIETLNQEQLVTVTIPPPTGWPKQGKKRETGEQSAIRNEIDKGMKGVYARVIAKD